MNERPLFRDREDAAGVVARALAGLAGRHDLLVLGVPRGGVLVARSIADALGAPLDVVVARKLGVPGLPEVALGAIAEGEDEVVPDVVGRYLGVERSMTDRIERRERRELERRRRLYREERPLPELRGKCVVLVDDGLATGATLRAAAQALRRRHPARIIAAVPVGSPAGCRDIASVVDDVVVPATPDPFGTVSAWYETFAPASDDDVMRALRGEPASCATTGGSPADETDERSVTIPLGGDGATLAGDLGLPNDWLPPGAAARGLVVLAHGGGSSRRSYRNRFLAGCIRMSGWATLRLDLLRAEEQEGDAASAVHRFDIPLIAERLRQAIDWAVESAVPGCERVTLFGASTGAAAAIIAAVERPGVVAAVVARGGRVDLAAHALPRLRAPILLIVGGNDAETLRWNHAAIRVLRGDITLKVVRGAGHTFEEPEAIGAVGAHVTEWLERHSVAGRDGAGDAWWRRIAVGRRW